MKTQNKKPEGAQFRLHFSFYRVRNEKLEWFNNEQWFNSHFTIGEFKEKCPVDIRTRRQKLWCLLKSMPMTILVFSTIIFATWVMS